LIRSVIYEGEKSCVTSALDSGLKLSLVLSTCAGNTAGKDLAALADELAKAGCILVIDVADVFFAEDANLSAATVSVSRTSCARCALLCGLSIHN
jgi:hypothetical protein